MPVESQGTKFRRASTVTVNSSAATAIDIQSTVIVCVGTIDFAALGFTTSMLIKCNAKDTAIYAVKSVAATAIGIFGAMKTTGSTNIIITGYEMGAIGEVTDFGGPGGAAAVIDVTHLESTAITKIIGLPDEGQFTMSLNYNATDTGQNGLKSDRAARVKNLYDIKFHDIDEKASAMPSRAAFFGYCQTFSAAGAVNGKVSANAGLEITGAVQYTTAVTS